MIPITVITDDAEYLFPKEATAISHLFALALAHQRYSSLQCLKINLIVAADIVIDLFMSVRELQTGSNKAFCTRLVKRMVSFQDKTRDCQSKEYLIYSAYNMVLALEGMGLLRGFGVTNRFSDSLRGDPERTSLRNIEILVKGY